MMVFKTNIIKVGVRMVYLFRVMSIWMKKQRTLISFVATIFKVQAQVVAIGVAASILRGSVQHSKMRFSNRAVGVWH